ncbi:NAD(P)-dependent oxidoreductase [Desulfovibrio porci]|uniref:NAD(P)-dependent oxidoreductase n=1 Tax=Desulfovibrio porci TaxID=2605782 RepID=UPI000A705CCE
MALHVINEARRCLHCKKPLCRTGCPISTNIPVMIEQFLNGNIDEAGQMLFDNNPLSIVCSLVCDHEKQCEGHCILGKKGSPVHISSIENYISERFLAVHHPPRPRQNGMAAAIIGSGPAGLTIAIILAQRGYSVTIFESHDRIGGVLRYGIPDFRLPKSILDRYQQRLLELGVRIRPNTTIGGALRMDDLFRDGYSAVFIGTGVWRPNSLGIKGESLGNVHFAIDYLCNPAVYNPGEVVSVIGAGNAAIDAARTILRHGARKVTVFARKPALAASPREVEYARVDGVDFHTCVRPVEIRPEGAVFRRLDYDAEGHAREVEGEDFLEPSDSVIIAIGQGPKDKIVSTSRGIEINERGLVKTDARGATTHPGIFASGDVVRGAKTVVEAVHCSKTVADAMDAYMQSLPRA